MCYFNLHLCLVFQNTSGSPYFSALTALLTFQCLLSFLLLLITSYKNLPWSHTSCSLVAYLRSISIHHLLSFLPPAPCLIPRPPEHPIPPPLYHSLRFLLLPLVSPWPSACFPSPISALLASGQSVCTLNILVSYAGRTRQLQRNGALLRSDLWWTLWPLPTVTHWCCEEANADPFGL